MEQPYQTSTLNALLPNILQLRLPRIPSFRHSMSSLNLLINEKRVDINPLRDFQIRNSPTDVKSCGINCNSSICSELIDQTQIDSYVCQRQRFKSERPRIETNNKLPKTRECGIIWKLAYHGHSILKIAVSESTTPSIADVSFARQLYVHSLTYLMRALPQDLTLDERLSIQAALPDSIVTSLDQRQTSFRTEIRSTSVLHRTLASTVVQLFVLFQFVLPYVKILLSKLWRYQSENQIILKVTSYCMELIMAIGLALKGVGQTRIGDLVIKVVQWFVEGIVGGVGEGIMNIDALVEKRSQQSGICSTQCSY